MTNRSNNLAVSAPRRLATMRAAKPFLGSAAIALLTPLYMSKYLASGNGFRCCATALLLVASSQASVIITFSQSGSNVVAQGTGTLDTAALTFACNCQSAAFVSPDGALVEVGPPGTNNQYQGFTGPGSFGPPGDDFAIANSGSGDIIGIADQNNYLLTPDNYVSGTPLSGSATWLDTTFSDLGLTPGTYIWTWGSGATADSFEVVIPSATPEPSSVSLTGGAIGLFAFGIFLRRRTAGLGRKGCP